MKTHWPLKIVLTEGENPLHHENILFPSFHIVLGLCKQFHKALSKDGYSSRCIRKIFPSLRDEKLKGIFDGTPISDLLKDPKFIAVMTPDESYAWSRALG